MLKHLAALAFIFGAASVAWLLLGANVENRTRQSGLDLASRVSSVWGAAHVQTPPRLLTDEKTPRALPLESTRVRANLILEPRQKGLLWFNTYTIQFEADYTFSTSGWDKSLLYEFPLPAARGQYETASLAVDGQDLAFTTAPGTLVAVVPGGKPTVRFTTRYSSKGQESWEYRLGPGTDRVKNLDVRVRTNFRDIDFADNTMAPTSKQASNGGWELTWASASLLSGFPVKIVMPERLQPGPLGAAIAYFAPVSLFFFFFVIFMITTVRQVRLHPMNYFFLAAAFFAFHLLFAYLADHLNIHATFFVCSLISTFLVVSYLRLVVDLRFAALEAGGAQFVFLILFSYAQFFQGYAGLTVTLGAIATLFLVMQYTAKLDWAQLFRAEGRPPTRFDSPGVNTVS
jgi:hypothetical protein